MYYIVRRATILIMTLLLSLFCVPLTAFAKAEREEVLKMGYYEDGDYMSLNQQGEYIGYNIEFIQELAKQSGLKFEVVDAVSWNAAYDMLVNGEIDLLPSVYFTEERAKEILFMTQPMCTIYTTLNVRMDDVRFDYEEYEAFEGMKVGIIRDGVDGERFKEFCQEHDVTVDIREYDETGTLIKALDDGILDGVAITHLGKNSSFRSVAQFAPNPMYMAVSVKKPDLLSELNRAMDNIVLSNPSYATDLYDKYLAPGFNQKPVFTKEEQEYIQMKQPVVVSYVPTFAPLAYQDKKTGEFKGVTADIFQYIAENSGLVFQFEPHPQSESMELLKQGMIDVVSVSDGDYLWDGHHKIDSTLYYLRTPTSRITRNGSEKMEVMALPQGYHLSEMIEKDNPDSICRYYPSEEACFEAVLRGEADVTYINTQVAGSFMSRSHFRGLHETTLGQYSNKMRIGVSKETDPRLFSIMNKCVQYLPVEQVDAFLVSNSGAKEISIAEFIGQHTWLVVGGVCSILGIIILLISYNLKNALHSNRRIQSLLYKDDLTGMDSINGFYRKWDNIISSDKRKELALLYGDIRQFRLINDNFGFAIGDKVLCACGQALKQGLKGEETCTRVSADNFVLLMEYDTWESLIERLKASVEMLNQWREQNTDLPYAIELVFGVYLIDQTDDTDINQMMDFANYARRYVKDVPGRFAMLYDQQMRDQAVMVRQLEGGLESALSQNEFEVYYQPKVSMDHGQIVGSEALIRWNHPENGFLMPGAFIPVFEKNGMIIKVDFWLFEDVCRTMHQWDVEGRKLLPVSCNFSRLHFKQKDFPERVSEVADRWNIPHHLLEIEITESALIDESEIIEIMLLRLKELGFQIAIDDFGSGYSSLGQLHQLPADVLKLDRGFVCHGVSGNWEQIVVRNVIHMAGELGMTVICEGVEDQEQSEILQKMGCRLAQGFHFYRPMKREEYEKLTY